MARCVYAQDFHIPYVVVSSRYFYEAFSARGDSAIVLEITTI